MTIFQVRNLGYVYNTTDPIYKVGGSRLDYLLVTLTKLGRPDITIRANNLGEDSMLRAFFSNGTERAAIVTGNWDIQITQKQSPPF